MYYNATHRIIRITNDYDLYIRALERIKRKQFKRRFCFISNLFFILKYIVQGRPGKNSILPERLETFRPASAI